MVTEKQEKLVVWKLDQRGALGDTPLHTCLLQATSIHADLAKWLLKVYPKLIYDIYMNEEYYGRYGVPWRKKNSLQSVLLFGFSLLADDQLFKTT